jgi:CBS domain-containing protein
MQVSQVMTRGVECARPNDSVVKAAERMRNLNIGSLPVCGENDRLVGMLTDRDITVRSTAAGKTPTDVRVEDVMTPETVYCFEDAPISDAASLMEQKQIRRLVVLSQDKRMVGIVSLGDLAVKSGDQQLSGEALERVSEPAAPRR